MFRWNPMLQTRFGQRREQPMARRRLTTVKPQLEELTPRILPSASSLPAVLEASPQAASAAAAITSYMFSMMEQRIATIEQELSNALYTVGQVIDQEVYAFVQDWDNILGIDPNAPNPSQATAVTQLGSGTTQPGGATTTALDAPNPTLTNTTPSSAGAGHT